MTAALPAVATAGIGLAIFGGVMLLLGIAIYIAAAAFSLFVSSFMTLLPFLPQFAMFAGLLMLLAIAGLLMLPAGIFAMIGLIMMGLGLFALGLGLLTVDSDDLRSLADMMTGLGKVAEFAGAGISESVPAVEELFEMLEDMSFQLLASITLFSALGNAFMDLGYGALLAALFLPALVTPLMLIGMGVVVWNEATQNLNSSLQQFFSFIPMWYEIMFIFALLVPLMNSMAFAVMMLAMFGFSAFFGLMMLSTGLDYVADSLNKIYEPTLDALIRFMETISELTMNTIDMLHELSWAMWVLGESLSDMEMWRFMSFSMSLDNVATASERLTVLTTERVDHVERVVDAARQYSELDLGTRFSVLGGVGNEFERLLEKIAKISSNQGGSGGSSGGGGSTVVLELDGKELGRTVEGLLGKRNKLTSMT